MNRDDNNNNTKWRDNDATFYDPLFFSLLLSSPLFSSMLLSLSPFVDSDTCLNSVSIQDSDRVSIQTVSLNSDTCLDSDTFLLPSPLISSLLHDTLLLFHTRVSIQNFRRVSIQTCFRCPCSSHRLSAQVSILKNFIVFSPKFVQCLFCSSKQHVNADTNTIYEENTFQWRWQKHSVSSL